MKYIIDSKFIICTIHRFDSSTGNLLVRAIYKKV